MADEYQINLSSEQVTVNVDTICTEFNKYLQLTQTLSLEPGPISAEQPEMTSLVHEIMFTYISMGLVIEELKTLFESMWTRFPKPSILFQKCSELDSLDYSPRYEYPQDISDDEMELDFID